jgi:hypothetical protein
VTPEEPQAAAVRLQVPVKAKLIGGKQIRFLGLTSGGHERKFLEEAGSSFAIPHEEEYFGKLSSADLTYCMRGSVPESLRRIPVPRPKVGTREQRCEGTISYRNYLATKSGGRAGGAAGR